MFRRALVTGCLGIGMLLPVAASAAGASVTLRHKHFLFPLSVRDSAQWQITTEKWTYNGHEISPPASLRVDGDAVPPLPAGIERTEGRAWNRTVIAQLIRSKVVPSMSRQPGHVTISRSASGKVLFEGVGLPGQEIDVDAATDLVIEALEKGVGDVWLPVRETPPVIVVNDPELRTMGVKELVTVGESDYSNSPKNRIHNIKVGIARFNGHLIPKDSVFSFVETLGPVDGSTGYKKELVIKGPVTVPDYGGGLCQISSTAYRGVWEYGFPIVQRKNHSFAVNHYAPQGTDATIYPPHVDMKFRNDSPGALVMQTHLDEEKELAYFIYYGTRDQRSAKVVGPFTWDHRSPPAPRTEYTQEISPGTKRKVGDAVPGMKSMWYRIVRKDGQEKVESVFSSYEARPLFYQIGASGFTGSGELIGDDAIDPAS